MAKLRTPEVEKLLKEYPLYSQDDKKGNTLVLCKFFLGSYTWYITEGSPEGNDFTLFGITCNGEDAEFGYISLNELEALKARSRIEDGKTGEPRGFLSLEVERDLFFKPVTLEELAAEDEVVRKHLLSMGYINEQ